MKIESLNKKELENYCQKYGIKIQAQNTKQQLLELINQDKFNKITNAVQQGKQLKLLISQIHLLSEEYASQLKRQIDLRKEEMKNDDTSHYLIYRVLGITSQEGQKIDEYQNTGRFLYNYAGSFLEEVASLCLLFNNPQGRKTTVKNSFGTKPKTFEIF